MKTSTSENGEAGRAQTRREWEMKIVRQVRDWIRAPGTLDRVFGPLPTYLEQRNRVRKIFGQPPLTKDDAPPGEDWEARPPRVFMTRKEHARHLRDILGVRPDDEEPENAARDNQNNETQAETPPVSCPTNEIP